MPQTLRATVETAKPTRVQSCPSRVPNVRKILPFELFLREIWPEERNRAKKYTRLTGTSAGTAKHRLRGRRDPGYGEIARIIRSDYGYEFIKHILGDERPAWFTAVERAKNIGETRKLQAQLSRRIAQLEMEIE